MRLVFFMTLIRKETVPFVLPPTIAMHPSRPHKLNCISIVCCLLAGEDFLDFLQSNYYIFFYDMSIPEVFDPILLINWVALAQPTQMHTG